jgi:hypothetical protein
MGNIHNQSRNYLKKEQPSQKVVEAREKEIIAMEKCRLLVEATPISSIVDVMVVSTPSP